MANLNAVRIGRGKVGTNRLGSDDSVSMLVGFTTNGVPSSMELGKVYVLRSLADAETLGLDKEYDISVDAVAWEHVKEFYRLASAGIELHLIFLNLATSDEEIESSLISALRSGNGSIKSVAFFANDEIEETPIYVDGVFDGTIRLLQQASLLVEKSEDLNMPVHVFVEGLVDVNSLGLKNARNFEYEGVSVVIGQDYDVASQKTTNKEYAFVGTVLGITAASSVQQNIGENERNNLTNAARKILINPGLSNHVKNNDVSFEKLQELEDKGYIFGLEYTGLAGVRLNNDHVCVSIVLDDENNVNEHTVAFSRVGKKARRLLRAAYLPKVKTDWLLDAQTGKLSPGTIVALEAIGAQVLADMQKREEITAGIVEVDPESDLIVEKELKVAYKIVPRGSIGEINGVVNLKTQL